MNWFSLSIVLAPANVVGGNTRGINGLMVVLLDVQQLKVAFLILAVNEGSSQAVCSLVRSAALCEHCSLGGWKGGIINQRSRKRSATFL